MVKMMNKNNAVLGALIAATLGFSAAVYAHGDMVPQSVNTGDLELLGDEWRDSNPYRAPSDQNALAIEIGSSAYTVRLLGGVNLPIVAFYAGFGYSNAASTFDLMGTFNDVPGMNGAAVTNPIALKYDEGSYDFNIGTRLRFGVFAIHADYTVGEYNMVTAGFGFNFR